MSERFKRRMLLVKGLLLGALLLFILDIGLFVSYMNGVQFLSFPESENDEIVIPALDQQAELLADDLNKDLVVTNCTGCHSARLIVQNRATREGWVSTIRWMQQTQNLWDLGENEEAIVAYLAKNYAPQRKGRRANLESIEWYELK